MISDLSIDTSLVSQLLTKFIKSESTRAGFKRAVVNLSGGLDSSVACVLTTKALGKRNVLALRLPYRTSTPNSLEHAQLLIDQLGIASLTIPITKMVDPLIELFPDTNPVRRGNIMARMRMIIAYDQSAASGGLVVGTGNKTEILLGYTTLYGDAACAFNPIGDLYKTQVRQLARALAVPEVIIQKPPSADLWPGQTDEGELGFTYEKVDQLLHRLVDLRQSPPECIQAGFKEEFIQSVLAYIRKNQFKRVLPPIARISKRTEGYGFLTLPDGGS